VRASLGDTSWNTWNPWTSWSWRTDLACPQTARRAGTRRAREEQSRAHVLRSQLAATPCAGPMRPSPRTQLHKLAASSSRAFAGWAELRSGTMKRRAYWALLRTLREHERAVQPIVRAGRNWHQVYCPFSNLEKNLKFGPPIFG
jgi:hypothetical protein